MEKATQHYALLEKLRQQQSLLYPWGNGNGYFWDASTPHCAEGECYPSENANTQEGKGSPRLTPTLLSFATATLALVCDRLHYAQAVERVPLPPAPATSLTLTEYRELK